MTLINNNLKILRMKSEIIQNPKEVEPIKKELIEHLEHLKGFGLVAIQIGIPKRVFVMRIENEFRTFVNPKILDQYDPIIVKGEGCFSFPGVYITTKRFKYITILNIDGRKITCEGMLAVAFQHEIDHLNGILFFDRKFIGTRKNRSPGRNDPCICGSKKKYKNCCIDKEIK